MQPGFCTLQAILLNRHYNGLLHSPTFRTWVQRMCTHYSYGHFDVSVDLAKGDRIAAAEGGRLHADVVWADARGAPRARVHAPGDGEDEYVFTMSLSEPRARLSPTGALGTGAPVVELHDLRDPALTARLALPAECFATLPTDRIMLVCDDGRYDPYADDSVWMQLAGNAADEDVGWVLHIDTCSPLVEQSLVRIVLPGGALLGTVRARRGGVCG